MLFRSGADGVFRVAQAQRLVAEQGRVRHRPAEGRGAEEPWMRVVHGERVRLDVLRCDEMLVGDELLADRQVFVGQSFEVGYFGAPAV